MNNKTDVTVTGVYEDFPLNTKVSSSALLLTMELVLVGNKWIETNGPLPTGEIIF